MIFSSDLKKTNSTKNAPYRVQKLLLLQFGFNGINVYEIYFLNIF